MYAVGDEVVWRRAKSTWSRITSERVHAVVVAVLPKRVRIRLVNRIKGSNTALVDPARLERR